MSSLEQPFRDAIAAKEIDSVVIVGNDVTNSFKYNFVHGDRIILDGTKKPLSPTDIVFLASSTKLLTTISALQCVEKGLLTLDSPIDSLAPELASQAILTGSDLAPNPNPITLRHLLTHSAGLTYSIFSPSSAQFPDPATHTTVASRFAHPLAYAPGTGWGYGTGIDWAGVLVERVSGLDLEAYFRTHIFAPLGIPASEFAFFPVKAGLAERMVDVSPADPEGLGLSVGGGQDVHRGATAAFGGHGGYATPRAYLAVLETLLWDDGRVLGKELRAEMFKGQLEDGAKAAMRALQSEPTGAFFAQGQEGGVKDLDFGFGGLFVGGEGEEGGLGKGSLVWGGGINSTWFIDPKNGICGFAAPQLGLPPSMAKAFELKDVFRKQLKNVHQKPVSKN